MKKRITKALVEELEPKPRPYEVHDDEMTGLLVRVQPTGKKSYYFTYRNSQNLRRRIRLGTVDNMTPANARSVAQQRYSDIMKGIDVQSEKNKQRKEAEATKNRRLGAFIDELYEPWILTHHKYGKGTMSLIRSRFACFMNTPLEEITVRRVEAWRKDRLGDGIKPTTVNRQVASLRGLLTKAVEWEVISEHPLQKLKALKTGTTPLVRYLSPGEETRLYRVLSDRDTALKEERQRGNEWRKQRNYPLLPDLTPHAYGDRMSPMIILSLKTGLRRGELFALTWHDVDMNNRVLTVRAENAKSSRTRHIPLNNTAYTALKAWHEQCDKSNPLVFPSHNGTKLTNVKKSWASILKQAEIPNFRWHDMRHDFASKLVMNGVPLNTVRELCGHADMNTTLRYAHLAPEHRADAVATLG